MKKHISIVVISLSIISSSAAYATDDWVKAVGVALLVNAVSGGQNRYGNTYQSSQQRQKQSQSQIVYVNVNNDRDRGYSDSYDRPRRHHQNRHNYDRGYSDNYDRPRVSVKTRVHHDSGGSEYWNERRSGRHGSSSRGGNNYWNDSYDRTTYEGW